MYILQHVCPNLEHLIKKPRPYMFGCPELYGSKLFDYMFENSQNGVEYTDEQFALFLYLTRDLCGSMCVTA